jgi:hypothetical protein
LLFNKEFLIDTLSRDEVRDLRLVEPVVGDGDGDETFKRGDKLDTDILSFTPPPPPFIFGPFLSTELERL